MRGNNIQNKKIGFIGQGWIGKNYADEFEYRGFDVVRYSLEEPYIKNKEKIKKCEIIFVAVPTPTSPNGFDDSILRKAVKEAGKGSTIVIKSTTIPGTTESIQKENPDLFVLHSPEFLTTHTAAHDVANPNRNIIGISVDSDIYRSKAQAVMEILPTSKYDKICLSKESEFIKYGGNYFYFSKVVLMNLFYDLVKSHGCDYEVIREGMINDPRIHPEHTKVGHKGGRGAGGECLIKDFEALLQMYEEKGNNGKGLKILESLRAKNIELLINSNKDIDLLKGVYGDNGLDENK